MNLLFTNRNLYDLLTNTEYKAYHEIDSFNDDDFLNRNSETLASEITQKYLLVTPQLSNDEEISIEHQETVIQINDFGELRNIKALEVTFIVPFSGDSLLFDFQPNSFTYNPPRANVRDNELRITLTSHNQNGEKLKQDFLRTLDSIRSYLSSTKSQIDDFYKNLPSKLLQKIEIRKKKLLADKGLIQSLGFPIKRRGEPPKTYQAPIQRKNLQLAHKRSQSMTFKPEPELEMSEYRHILSVISQMTLVMERSPKAFEHMQEEHLRDQFLVQLNAQYEGQATGETFNCIGKTDILIRVENRNIFIAECKYWHGESGLTDTVDQLLGYLSWRDTKTAIILFNRNKNFSQVLQKIPDVVSKHPNYRRTVKTDVNSSFQFVLFRKDDIDKELILTVLAFDVPKTTS